MIALQMEVKLNLIKTRLLRFVIVLAGNNTNIRHIQEKSTNIYIYIYISLDYSSLE